MELRKRYVPREILMQRCAEDVCWSDVAPEDLEWQKDRLIEVMKRCQEKLPTREYQNGIYVDQQSLIVQRSRHDAIETYNLCARVLARYPGT